VPALGGRGLPQARGRVAFAVVHDGAPAVFLGESVEILARVLAVEVVARTPAASFGEALGRVRQHLLDEHWTDAIVEWMNATGNVIDVYPDEVVWNDREAGEDQTLFEIRLSPIFRDPPKPSEHE
jgi:hypothetical protein